ncbi:hypothetical protein HNR17_000572 [Galbitalea soli]|nr:hypothetical protein [Galbitalea soli]
MPEEVHIELSPPVLHTEHLERTIDRDPCVVDDGTERAPVRVDLLDERRDLVGSRDIEQDGSDSRGLEVTSVGRSANAGEYLESSRRELSRRRGTHTSRSPADEDDFSFR